MGRRHPLTGDDAVPALMRTTPHRLACLLVAVLGSLMIPTSVAQAHSIEDAARQRAHIEERARSVMGNRYSYGGSSPSTGFDCSGFTRWVFSGHGADLPHRSIDQFDMAGQNGSVRVRKIRNLERGDLVFFKTTSARVGHAGIYLAKGNFIHSSSAAGEVRISSLAAGYYRDKFVGATRVRVIRN